MTNMALSKPSKYTYVTKRHGCGTIKPAFVPKKIANKRRFHQVLFFYAISAASNKMI
ncbi:hypothetical protein AOT82_1363 [Psychrobacter sp. AntiMn-1]|nr:hypothetical protein AOT82_1363 [Psychrobacter sp. AntiMn-1]